MNYRAHPIGGIFDFRSQQRGKTIATCSPCKPFGQAISDGKMEIALRGKIEFARFLPFIEACEQVSIARVYAHVGATHDSELSYGNKRFFRPANTVRIDFGHDMVIVMTRYTAGKNFPKCHPLLIKTIADALE